ncbi:MAG: GNAT family N-acetyltransferase [Oscillospiraceae bacterium]|nr:GNAT family N-acetyltransferase [Oscillospiraceae bacterium]
MSDLYKGFAQKGQEKELIRFLDRVFTRINFRTVPYFMSLLPKLYKTCYDPCANNLVIRDEKGFRAAVGLYMLDYRCGDSKLLAGGIGNVAVDKKFRGYGYMKELMNDVFAVCKERNADFMVLGGLRHRYNYFGYERVGQVFEYRVTKTNLRHALRGVTADGYSLRRVTEKDSELLAQIKTLREGQTIHVPCKDDALFDTMRSWLAKPYAVMDGEKLAGYFIINKLGTKISELCMFDNHQLPAAVTAIFQQFMRPVIKFEIAPAQTMSNEFFRRLCEVAEIKSTDSYLILNFRNTLQVLMENSGTRLIDGELIVGIKGFAGDENLRISVENRRVSVTQTQGPPEYTLEHLVATRVFFDAVCPERDLLPPPAQAWFPLALYFPHADMV